MERLGVLAMFRNEAPYLQEWVDFYRWQGATRFWLYDNESTDGGVVAGDDVDITLWDGEQQQFHVYGDGVSRACGEVEWLVIVDCDEFIYHPSGMKLAQFVTWERIQGAGSIFVPWRMFGWGPHERRPAGGVVDNYRFRARDEHPLHKGEHGKSIVRPETVEGGNAHVCQTTLGQVSGTGLLCNHYWTKSREEALEKFKRPRADTGGMRSWEEYESIANDLKHTFDDRLARQWRQRHADVSR